MSPEVMLALEIDRLEDILREINAICYIPSKGRHAYTHFQADFDRIRKLTEEWHRENTTA
jgi:hypothetical protein